MTKNMKVLLIIAICLLVYLVMAFITGLLDAIDDYVPIGDDDNFSSASVGLVWPITLPILIVGFIIKGLDNAIKKFANIEEVKRFTICR